MLENFSLLRIMSILLIVIVNNLSANFEKVPFFLKFADKNFMFILSKYIV
jgi:hypothetical protein